MKLFGITSIVALLAALLFAGCSSDKNKFVNQFILDNPTSSPVTAVVDGKSYDLPSHEYVELTFLPGRHSMTTAYGEDVNFIVTIENNGGVLNPTRSTYYKSMKDSDYEETTKIGELKFPNFAKGVIIL